MFIGIKEVQENMKQQSSYNLLKDVERVIRTRVEDNSVYEDIIQRVSILLQDYDISQKCYALTNYTNENIRIINNYKACLLVEGKSSQTIEAYAYRINHLYTTSGINLKEMGPYDIRFYLALCKNNGCSNRTLDNIRCYISAFYKWMLLEELIEKNPCSPIKPIKYTAEIKEGFDDVELEKLRSCCKTMKERSIVELLLSSGIRVQELSDMNVDDLDFKNNIVHVKHGKGDKERFTYMSPVASYYILKYLEDRKDKDIELFKSSNGRLQSGGIRWMLKDLGDRAGVENVHPHKFRHTFATNLNRRGMPVQDIQHLLGHSSIDTTMIYVNIDNDAIHSEYQKYHVG